MAIINKTGIGEGNLIVAEHVTRAIDALSGGSSDTIIATGSFSGSFTGTFAGSVTSASYAATASYLSGTITSASYATTASFAATARTASYVTNLNQNVIITGSLTISSSGVSSLTVKKQATFDNIVYMNSQLQTNTVYIGGARHEAEITTTTTNGTLTNIWSASLSEGEVRTIDAIITGVSMSASNTYAIGGNLTGVVRAQPGATGVGIVGQTSSSFENFTGTPLYGINSDGAGGYNVYVYVQGLASTTIEWTAAIRSNSIRSGLGGA